MDEVMSGSDEGRGGTEPGQPMRSAQPVQDALFDDPNGPPADGELIGYRGPTACSAAGITYRQLDYWARTGLVAPTIRSASGSGSQRLYSFKDILVLKVVKRLLDTGVSLQNIRTAVEHLRARGVEDLAGVTLLSDGVSVYECHSSEEIVDLLSGRAGRVRHRGQRRLARTGRIAGEPARRTCRRRDRRERADRGGRADASAPAAHRYRLTRSPAGRAPAGRRWSSGRAPR